MTTTEGTTPSSPESPVDIYVPRVVNLREARILAAHYPAVITAGPSAHEVEFGHFNHYVESFGDVDSGPGSPTIDQVERLLNFAADNVDSEILVHCHAGMSRSTATAWGILMDRGVAPYDAYDLLQDVHPVERHSGHRRWFIPNPLIVQHLEDLFGYDDLVKYAATRDNGVWW